MKSGYVKVALKSEIPIGEIKMAKLGDQEVLIANVNARAKVL